LHAGSLKFNSENFTLSVLIEETLANFKLIEQKHQVVFGNQVNGLVQVDKFRLAQALINIITNAIKYSPSKDTFYLNVYKSGNEKEFLITICDLEMNISPENIDSLFERFSKIEQTIQGAGLDLFMASEIIKQHGGKIGFQSKENHQTEFFFSIPAISAQKTC
jgi:signal transduction histidine kinase